MEAQPWKNGTDSKEAGKSCEKAVEFKPDGLPIWNNLGNGMAESGAGGLKPAAIRRSRGGGGPQACAGCRCDEAMSRRDRRPPARPDIWYNKACCAPAHVSQAIQTCNVRSAQVQPSIESEPKLTQILM
ncbi:MAG: hypothetical protein KME26_21190 [Oscillatoria princeps RMCB-10]|jgi:hypothetical protein|nr:hypothetical protein [Oscillatoria princeps RMCB-10]